MSKNVIKLDKARTRADMTTFVHPCVAFGAPMGTQWAFMGSQWAAMGSPWAPLGAHQGHQPPKSLLELGPGTPLFKSYKPLPMGKSCYQWPIAITNGQWLWPIGL